MAGRLNITFPSLNLYKYYSRFIQSCFSFSIVSNFSTHFFFYFLLPLFSLFILSVLTTAVLLLSFIANPLTFKTIFSLSFILTYSISLYYLYNNISFKFTICIHILSSYCNIHYVSIRSTHYDHHCPLHLNSII